VTIAFGGIATRSLLLATAVVATLVIATQVPLVPVAEGGRSETRLVPLDTWAAGRFPAARDLYRARFAVLVQPKRLPVLALWVAVFAAAAFSFPHRLGAWLGGRVPPLSALSLGMFRLFLGLALFATLRFETPPGAVPWEMQRAADWLAGQALIRTLAASPDAGYWLWQASSIALLCFALGVWSRVSLVATATLMTLYVGVSLTSKAMHDWGIPLVTLWVLTVVPWRDSVGVQTAFARWRGRPSPAVPPSLRGLAVWLPGLTLGMAFAAAAFAKLDTSGLSWIAGGAVRFHFIEDARQAPVAWGLVLARSDVAAVALSLAAVVIEGGFWLVTLVRGPATRAVVGLIGLAMLTGFYLLQGVFWPAWWALFLAFVPWSWLDRVAATRWTAAEDRPRYPPATSTAGDTGVWPASIPALPAAVIVVMVLQQPIVSALRVESEPFVSDYSMYSYTWPTRDAFDVHLVEKTARYELAVPGLAGPAFEQRLRGVPRAVDILSDAIGLAARGEPWPEATRAAVDATGRDYFARFGDRLSSVEVRVLRRGFDWDRGAFDALPRMTTLGVLDLEAGRFR
jgi:hypothetical protein